MNHPNRRSKSPTAKARTPLASRLGFILLFASSLVAVARTQAQAPAAPTAPTAPAQATEKPAPTPPIPTSDQTAANPSDPAAPDKAALDAMTPKQRELAEDTAKLLQLANELKADMDKSSKEMLSLAVVKKADQIERLARKVREELRVNLGIVPGN